MNDRSGGFTLIEVIVALAIVATALYAATGSIRSAARGSGHLEETTLAHWAALNALNESKLVAPAIGSDSPAATVTLYGHEFVVERQLAPATDDTASRVSVTVASAATPDLTVYTLDAALP